MSTTDISPIKMIMFDSSSREDSRSQARENDKKEFSYNPTIHISRYYSKRFHTVSPIKTENIKAASFEEKSQSMIQEIKTERCIKIMPMNNNLECNIKIDSEKSKLEEIAEEKKVTQKSTRQPKPKYKLFLLRIIDSNYTLAVMTLLTLFSLFSSDMQAGFCSTSVDFPFDIIQCIIMTIFTIEIIGNSLAKEDYMWSFFFWLDIVATVSLIQDISFIFDPIMGVSSTYTVYQPAYNSSFINSNTTSANNKNGKQAQNAVHQFSSASRATRVLRIVRIIRLIRILKLYKNALLARANMNKKIKKKANYKFDEISFEETLSNHFSKDVDVNIRNKLENQAADAMTKDSLNMFPLSEVSISKNSRFWKRSTLDSLPQLPRIKRKSFYKINKIETIPVEEILKESKISQILSESITKKIITLIIGMLIILPIMTENFYQDDSLKGYTILSKYIENYWLLNPDYISNNNVTNIPNGIIGTFISKSADQNFPIVSILINTNLFYLNSSWIDHRFRNFETLNAVSDNGYVQIVYSDLTTIILSAYLSIAKTLFVCALIALSAMYFERDARDLVLHPLEVMIEIVDSVSKDPINASDIKKLKSGLKSTIGRYSKKGNRDNLHQDNYEMKVIEKAILKISALLAIGFGEAGGEILKENLSSGNELNPLIKGKKKTAIFGFCDIRNFTEITEALEETTILFVNKIADLVHTSVEKFGGAANKNSGEAFLMVWKFKNDQETEGINEADQLKSAIANDNMFELDPNSSIICNTADMTVLGFLSVIKRINKDPIILEYRNDPKILEKIKDFKVNMGFGLHMGWAIEGAIGSSYKIDASYLSPNVNISARLEAATRQYGVSILISGALYDQLSSIMKEKCRLIDIVKLKGSNVPIKLYTIDVNLDFKKKLKQKKKILTEKVKKDIFLEKKNKIREMVKSTENIASEFLSKKSYVELLKTGRNFSFYSKWEIGFELYIAGKWKDAETFFEDCLFNFPSDGPCINLLNYIRSQDSKTRHWPGYRVLTSK